MLINFYVNLAAGDLCKVVTATIFKFNGQIAEFKGLEYYFQLPVFVFETENSEKIIAASEDDFEVLPYKASLLFLIDLAMDMKDAEWYEELVYKLKYESQN